jgi:hypothetical protein
VLRYDIVVVSTLLHCNSSYGQDDDDGRAALNVALLMTVVIMTGTLLYHNSGDLARPLVEHEGVNLWLY